MVDSAWGEVHVVERADTGPTSGGSTTQLVDTGKSVR